MPSDSVTANAFLYKLTPVADSCAYAAPKGDGAYGTQHVTGNVDMMSATNIVPNLRFSATEVNVPGQYYTAGFPGEPTLQEWFGVCYDGGFTAADEGEYTFVTAVDDSVAISVDGKLLFNNNDGMITPSVENNLSSGLTTTACKEAGTFQQDSNPLSAPSVHLTAGKHSIMIQYMQGWPVYLGVQIWLLPPGESYEYNATSAPTPPSYTLLQMTGPPNGVLACPHPVSSPSN
jgi:hypothetical protein